MRIRWLALVGLMGLWALFFVADLARAACCYFSAKGMDIEQPAQKVFITWDPAGKQESFTVQPKFSGNALDFGMVIPTPSQPKLHEMPRNFFKGLAVYSILKQRQFPQSNLVWGGGMMGGGMMGMMGMGGGGMMMGGMPGGFIPVPPRPPAIKILETGLVGSLDYKIIRAGRADDLYSWLKDHKYRYAGDEATLDFYIKKKWVFTVMKIDTMQMKKDKDGTFTGDVSPTRFTFTSEKLIYPLKITQLSVKDKTEALFYIQAPTKMDLQEDMSYQYQWIPMLQATLGKERRGTLPKKADAWLKAMDKNIPDLLKRAEKLEFTFVSGQRPQPNSKGRTPTTMEWSRRLTNQDIGILQGIFPYSEKVPNPDAGFTNADLQNPRRAQAVARVIQYRLQVLQKLRPNGFLVREAPAQEVANLRILVGHLQAGAFITKFRKTFTREEMDEDLEIVPARYQDARDDSEYDEILPASPP
jgi:hypothetical protein